MLGFQLGGGALAGLIVVTVAVVIVAWLILRIIGRDHLVRVARIGVFVERQRVGEPAELWTADPLDAKSKTRPAPLPPPTPPPPLPPRPEDEPTQTWPKREEP